MTRGIRRSAVERVHAYLCKYPGLSAEAISNGIDHTPATTRNCLAALARTRRAHSIVVRDVRRHFPIPGPVESDCIQIAMLRETNARALVVALAERGMTSRGALAHDLNLGPSTLRNDLHRLEAAKLVTSIDDAVTGNSVLVLSDLDATRALLCAYPEPPIPAYPTARPRRRR